jgi:hypothetical protein
VSGTNGTVGIVTDLSIASCVARDAREAFREALA